MRYGFVIDQTRCIGCHACTVACKEENRVPLGALRTWVKYVEKGEFPNIAPALRGPPLQPLRQRALRDDLPDRGALPAAGRDRRLRPRPLHRLQVVHAGVPVRRALHRSRARTPPPSATSAPTGWTRGLEPACVIVCPVRAILTGDLDDPDSEVSRVDRAGARQSSGSRSRGRARSSSTSAPTTPRSSPALQQASARDHVEQRRGRAACRSRPRRRFAAGPAARGRHRSPSRPWAAPCTTCRTSPGPGAGASARTCGPSRSPAGAALFTRGRRARRGERRRAAAFRSSRCSFLLLTDGLADRRPQASRSGSTTSCSAPNPRSWLVLGAWILLAFGAALVAWLLAAFGAAVTVLAVLAAAAHAPRAGGGRGYSAFLSARRRGGTLAEPAGAPAPPGLGA